MNRKQITFLYYIKLSHPDGEDPQPMETEGGGDGGKARELERLNDGQPK